MSPGAADAAVHAAAVADRLRGEEPRNRAARGDGPLMPTRAVAVTTHRSPVKASTQVSHSLGDGHRRDARIRAALRTITEAAGVCAASAA